MLNNRFVSCSDKIPNKAFLNKNIENITAISHIPVINPPRGCINIEIMNGYSIKNKTEVARAFISFIENSLIKDTIISTEIIKVIDNRVFPVLFNIFATIRIKAITGKNNTTTFISHFNIYI